MEDEETKDETKEEDAISFSTIKTLEDLAKLMGMGSDEITNEPEKK